MAYAFNPRPTTTPSARIQARSSAPRTRSFWTEILTGLGGGAIIGTGIGVITIAIKEAVRRFFGTEVEKIESEMGSLLERREVLQTELSDINQQLEELRLKREDILAADAEVEAEPTTEEGGWF